MLEMVDYELEARGLAYNVELSNGTIKQVGKKWVDNQMESLEISEEEAILLYLSDNDILIDEEQESLDREAKANKVKVKADTAKPKTQRERVVKENPTKEAIIQTIAKALGEMEVADLVIENKGKLITFSYNGENYKVDLVQKRRKKDE